LSDPASRTWGKADLHIHSDHSDGLPSIPEILDHVAEDTDLDVIAITDHNTLEGALFAKSLEALYDFDIVVGEEVSSTAGHILGLFLSEEIPPGLSAEATLERIEDQGGVAIIPHPFANRAFGPFGLKSIGDAIEGLDFHGLETYNSSPYLLWANRVAARAWDAGSGVAAVGGSDSHVLRAIGTGYTLFPGTTAPELREALDQATTRAAAGGGQVAVALRYMTRWPRIRRLQAWNWERCKP
jgi:predicted metal-dependent phosphoesterase TrpH